MIALQKEWSARVGSKQVEFLEVLRHMPPYPNGDA